MLKDVPLVVFLRFARGGWMNPEPSHKNIHPIHSCCFGDGERDDIAQMDGRNSSWNGSHPNKLLRLDITPPMGLKGRMNLHDGKEMAFGGKLKCLKCPFLGLELMDAGEDTYLCFWMSFTPFFKFPNLSDGLSL